ncbi:MAG: hypothetical protein K6E41_04500 [Solobacterium sp.]|nr:hypothetical protein [Solobacterium sp.]
MTAEEMYENVKALMFERLNSVDFDENYIPWLNIVLSENFDINNSIRTEKGLSPLYKRPVIRNEADRLNYEEEMINEILPLGLAKYLWIDDDHENVNIFDALYQNAQQRYMKFAEVPMKDVYGWG